MGECDAKGGETWPSIERETAGRRHKEDGRTRSEGLYVKVLME